MPDAAFATFGKIPGVGRSVSRDLWDMGFRAVEELCGRDPEALYREFSALRGCHIDRCMLYVFRCAVYYASHETHEPELLKWWNWKDGGLADRQVRRLP